MKGALRPSPMMYASCTWVGSLLVLGVFTQVLVDVLRMVGGHGTGGPFRSDRLGLVGFLVAFLCGAGISLMAERRLRNGVRDQVWTEEELEPLRRRFDHPAWTVLAWVPSVMLFVVFFNRQHLASLCLMLILPLQTGHRLRQILEREVGSGSPAEWRSFKPIQSEHWGEPRRDSLSL